MMSLWALLKIVLLCTNAVTILNRPRFLARFETNLDNSMSLKSQVVNFVLAAQYMRAPLIPVNVLVIFVGLLFGG
ncbi:hypothetical protein M885DRAFT_510003 [Pelagophyceae sp. CCMP2097]|nr:hypothetical protein M885DRAFT_510003 [Pelagophyceae sp. CCMP2097]